MTWYSIIDRCTSRFRLDLRETVIFGTPSLRLGNEFY